MLIISKKQCKNCKKLKEMLDKKSIKYMSLIIEDYIDTMDDDEFIMKEMQLIKAKWNISMYPMLFIDGEYLGDYGTIEKMNTFEEFNSILSDKGIGYETVDEDF